MDKHVQHVKEKIREIDREIAALHERRKALVNLHARFIASEVLRPGEELTPRNASKYGLLAKVVNYLNSADKSGKKQDHTTRGIFDHIISAYGDRLNYNTFRSYMLRFKEEQRLTQETKTGRWLVANDQEELF